MKHSMVFKFAAILLSALSIVGLVACIVCISVLGNMNLYVQDMEDWLQDEYRDQAYTLASALTKRYANRALSDAPRTLLESYYYYGSDDTLANHLGMDAAHWSYSILDADGNQLDSDFPLLMERDYLKYTFSLSATYPMCVTNTGSFDEAYAIGNQVTYLRYLESPEYIVQVYLNEEAFTSYDGIPVAAFSSLYENRYSFFLLFAIFFLLCAAGTSYLCWTAGICPISGQVRPGGLNRLPLDLYMLLVVLIGGLLVALAFYVSANSLYRNNIYNIGSLFLSCTALLAASLLFIGMIYGIAAQSKLGAHSWWTHCLTYRFSVKLVKGLRSGCRWCLRLFSLLPLTWRWLLPAVSSLAVLLACSALAFLYGFPIPLILAVAISLAAVCYCIYAYGTLLHGVKKISAGALDAKIPTKHLFGVYGTFARELNLITETAYQAAQKQLRAERTKAELITNVSHDIKTPLTSVINYVTLLEQAPSEEERSHYLSVLQRQSLQLKKLVEDLVEMSKVSSGNIPVEQTRFNAVEVVNQALGEFSTKLETAGLTPVFQASATDIPVFADGRLVWRVLSNLLSNTVKYALPGTRVYLDLVQLENSVLLSLKNVSREPLNIPAEALTERFVQGDLSRSSGGSGLGLHIAKSLMQLQKGHLQIHVDGDLFKVTLVFPVQ